MNNDVWIDGRVVEGARLEIVCTPKAYREFESLSIRHYNPTIVWGLLCVDREDRTLAKELKIAEI